MTGEVRVRHGSFSSSGVAGIAAVVALVVLSACGRDDRGPTGAGASLTVTTPLPSLALAQGDSVDVDLVVRRGGGSTAAVTVAIAGTPQGVTATVLPAVIAGDSARLHLVAAAGAAPATYRLTLTPQAAGVDGAVATLDVAVVPLGAVAVDVAYCTGLAPQWLAFQDGDGAWTRGTAIVTPGRTTFRHVFATPRGAVATASDFANGLTLLSVQYGAPAELAIVGDTVPAFCAPDGQRTLLGTVAGLETNEIALLTARGAQAVVSPLTAGEFTLRGLSRGPQDVLATRTTQRNGAAPVTGIILRRLPELPDGTALDVFDFTSPEAFAPVVSTLTVHGATTAGVAGTTGLHTPHTESIIAFLGSDSAGILAYGIPAARLQDGELQRLSVSDAAGSDSPHRSAAVYFRAPSDRTVTLGASFAAPAFSTVARTPALRIRTRLAGQPEYDRSAAIAFQQGATTLVSLSMTAAYAAASGAGYDLVVPDFAGAEGFDPRWALQPTGTVLWNAIRVGGTLDLGVNAVPFDGATRRSVSASGTLVP